MFAATTFGANGWLLEIGTLRRRLDPWLTGPLVFWLRAALPPWIDPLAGQRYDRAVASPVHG